MDKPNGDKVLLEDYIKPTDKYLQEVGDVYSDYYYMRNQRQGMVKHFQNKSFEDYLTISRELFWNSMITESEDLKELGLDFSLPFIRKEVLDYLGNIVKMGIRPKLAGEGVDQFGIKVLDALQRKWRFKTNDKVEKFWQVLYGLVNGTVCLYVGFDAKETNRRFLRAYNPATGAYSIEEKKVKMWNDVTSEIAPIEEMFLKKIWERNIQKQGQVIRRHEFEFEDFQKEFPSGEFPDAAMVVPGSRIDENSLFFKLLGNSGVLGTNKVQVLKEWDDKLDKYKVTANGVWINRLGRDDARPLPFKHGNMPFVWSITEPIDEKLAYGLSMPFKLKDPHKILNASYTMLVERELRAIDPPILTSDFEAPEIIFGQKKVIPVNDVAAYKELQIAEASGQFFTMQNSLQGLMSSFGQGGYSQVAPSRQPKSAREIMALETLKQQALGNALIMYYDLIFQEMMLVEKTALQFYESGKYSNQEENLLRTFTVPNFPLTQGGIGDLEVRIVREPQDAMKLYFEAVQKSIKNGKSTEILEVPVEMLNNLAGFFIEDIKLEPEQSSDMERSTYFEQVLTPILNVFIPAGVADISKTYLRFLEKMGEHPSDYTSDQTLSQIMNGWGTDRFKMPTPEQLAMMKNAGAGAGGAMAGMGAQTGNILQSMMGTRFGSQSNGGYGRELATGGQ